MNNLRKISLQTALLFILFIVSQGALANAIQYFGGLSFENPANLSLIKHKQVVAGDSYGATKLHYNGTARVNGLPFGPLLSGTANGDVDVTLPFFRYAMRMDPKLVLSFDISSPFATNVIWPTDSIARYASTKTMLRTTDYSPNISYNVLPQLALGAGLDIMYAKAALNRMIFIPFVGDVEFKNSGDNTAFGGHVGMLYKYGRGTFVGLTYFSKITFHLSGDSTLGSRKTRVTTTLPMPPTTLLSLTQALSKDWLVNAMIIYSQMNVLKQITLKNTVLGNPAPFIFSSQNYWRFSLGSQYNINETWGVRGQVAYEEAPANDNYRSLALPSAPLYSILVGGHYQANKVVGFDAWYGHAFIQNSTINNVQNQTFGRLEMSSNRVEARVTLNFI